MGTKGRLRRLERELERQAVGELIVLFWDKGTCWDRPPWREGARQLLRGEVETLEGRGQVLYVRFVDDWRDDGEQATL